MSAIAAHQTPQNASARLLALVGTGAIFIGVLLSGFVINEPAPYEIYMAGLIAVWILFGLRISGTTAILLTLFIAFNLGGVLAVTQMPDSAGAPLYIAVSLFLALTSVFFTAVLEQQPQLFRIVFLAWTVAALAAATLGIAGYFGIASESFTRYGRASGSFQDPNVFGPFLVAPAMLLLYRIYTGSVTRCLLAMPILLVLAGGVFFSFSRGAWGTLLLSGVLLTGIMLLQPSKGTVKLRIAILSILAVAALAIAIIVALQLPGVAEVFESRAQLEQPYDSGRFGRFGRHWIGWELAMSTPLGIGPMVFGKMFGEDTHSIWLKAILDYGWLGFVAYVVIVVITLAGGLRLLFRNRPWQPYLLCAYVTFVAHVALGAIIDTDHWRHFYLLVGLIWAAIALENRHGRRQLLEAKSLRLQPTYR